MKFNSSCDSSFAYSLDLSEPGFLARFLALNMMLVGLERAVSCGASSATELSRLLRPKSLVHLQVNGKCVRKNLKFPSPLSEVFIEEELSFKHSAVTNAGVQFVTVLLVWRLHFKYD